MNSDFGSRGFVALTGATGFLGKALLARLLEATDVSIIGLVRATSIDDAEQRGQATLQAALGREPTESEHKRVRWLRADIEETRLGLNSTDWNLLASSVGDIIHCAASVRFDLDLDQSHRINVGGTANMLDIAVEAKRRGSFGTFHHISTAFVAGTAAGITDADHLPADRAANFRNTYERTKARAERLLRSQSEVAVVIHRPSIVAGDSETGFTDNWNVLYGPMRMIAKGQLPVLPAGGDQLLDTVAVDYVARAVVQLAIDRPGRAGHPRGHHLTAGPGVFTVTQFTQACYRIACLFDNEPSAPELLSPARWKLLTASISLAARAPKRLRNLRRWGRLGARGLKGFSPYAPYTTVSSRFDNRREDELLRSAGITMPTPLRYLETIATFAIGTDFGRDPVVTPYQATIGATEELPA